MNELGDNGQAKSVNNHRLTARANFIVLSSNHNWVDGMKFIAHCPGNNSRYPAILPNKTWRCEE